MARGDGKHPVLCACGRATYRSGGKCWICAPSRYDVMRAQRTARLYPPAFLPETYLIECAAELARRREAA